MTFVLQNGWSPLYIASFNGHLDVVKTLIEAGASVNQTNKVVSKARRRTEYEGFYRSNHTSTSSPQPGMLLHLPYLRTIKISNK